MVSIPRLRELFTYDDNSGALYRGERLCCARDTYGYVVVGIDRKLYKAHRVIWALLYGAWPAGHIDHIDGERDNNRRNNLREVDRFENMQNMRAHKDNASGYLGVHWHPRLKHWRAQVTVRGIHRVVGGFTTPELAHHAYVDMKRQLLLSTTPKE